MKKALPRSPPARPHFTGCDQLDPLDGASESTRGLGFMVRVMALCPRPRTHPGNRHRYVRRNGPCTLLMTAGITTQLPYGNRPHLWLAWISTKEVRTQDRKRVPGASLAEFKGRQSGGLSSRRFAVGAGARARTNCRSRGSSACSIVIFERPQRSAATGLPMHQTPIAAPGERVGTVEVDLAARMGGLAGLIEGCIKSRSIPQ